jgi:high-affinity K+ transport system ATPase subunit B
MRERFAELRADGHPHGDDHRRQPADRRRHRAEAGVDDFLAEATPEDKLA